MAIGSRGRIRFTVLGDEVLTRRLYKIGRNAIDLSDGFDRIFDAFEDWTGEQFATQGAYMGPPWAPLQPATIAEKAREGAANPAQALVRTGALALSLQGGPGGIRRVGPGEARWGSNDPKLGYHHGKMRSASNPVPRRPVFRMDEARQKWITQVLQRELFR